MLVEVVEEFLFSRAGLVRRGKKPAVLLFVGACAGSSHLNARLSHALEGLTDEEPVDHGMVGLIVVAQEILVARLVRVFGIVVSAELPCLLDHVAPLVLLSDHR